MGERRRYQCWRPGREVEEWEVRWLTRVHRREYFHDPPRHGPVDAPPPRCVNAHGEEPPPGWFAAHDAHGARASIERLWETSPSFRTALREIISEQEAREARHAWKARHW